MRQILPSFIIALLLTTGCKPTAKEQNESVADERLTTIAAASFVKTYAPTRFITKGPKHHWFGYYDKLEFDPTGRYVLSNEVNFEGRSPTADDVIKVGMIDTQDNDKWIELGESRAWGWQQGCMLQFLPNSDTDVIWNDRQGDKFVSHVMNIKTMQKRTLPFPIYALSPDGIHAVTTNFERINNLRRGYGYAGIPDPNENNIAPSDAGIYLCNLETGESNLIISLAQMMTVELPSREDPVFLDYPNKHHWFNHLLFNTDGSRFIFLHRWKLLKERKKGSFGTLMYTSDLVGKDLRLVDDSGYTSHFIWKNPTQIMAWSKIQPEGDGFYLFDDLEGGTPQLEGKDIMTRNGHNTYLTIDNNDWILNDTYPNKERVQKVYLYHVPTKKRIPIGDFYLDPKYKGEWRVDTHPRSSPDGMTVVIDCPNGESGRQLALIDISGIAGTRRLHN
ncbi:MAG: hypothetical protein JXQ96_23505 [Cyclobacteriaceae bacterium]